MTTDYSRVALPTRDVIVREWDAIAAVRARQIDSGVDISYLNVLIPAIRDLLPNGRGLRILDAGCGVGRATAALAEHAREIVGIDPSAESISLARELNVRGVTFRRAWVEDIAKEGQEYDVLIANMMLSTMVRLKSGMAAMRQLIRMAGSLIVTLPHPCFWPAYAGYADADWFDYATEMAIRGPFRISREATAPNTTHIHRPLEQYLNALGESGLNIIEVVEPPSAQGRAQTIGFESPLPHLLAFRAVRQR
jgi:SAM-dependent methyltransferase